MRPRPLPEIGEHDLIWLAGLLEGEGCFLKSKQLDLGVALQMTDLDVVERAASLMGGKVRKSRPPVKPWHKQQWRTDRYGYYAAELMRLLLPHMGQRRSAKMAELLADWDSREHKMPKGSGLRTPAKCHPDKPVFGGSLCQTCYMRRYRDGFRVRGDWPALTEDELEAVA